MTTACQAPSLLLWDALQGYKVCESAWASRDLDISSATSRVRNRLQRSTRRTCLHIPPARSFAGVSATVASRARFQPNWGALQGLGSACTFLLSPRALPMWKCRPHCSLIACACCDHIHRCSSLQANSLEGSIPTELGMPNVDYMYLDSNSLTGTLPTELGRITNLRQLYVLCCACSRPRCACLSTCLRLCSYGALLNTGNSNRIWAFAAPSPSGFQPVKSAATHSRAVRLHHRLRPAPPAQVVVASTFKISCVEKRCLGPQWGLQTHLAARRARSGIACVWVGHP